MKCSVVRQVGLSLIEVLTAVAVLGILMAAAAGPMADLMARKRLESAARELASDVALARSQSLMSGRVVAVGLSERCYTVWTDVGGLPCTCKRTSGCKEDAKLKQVNFANASHMPSISSNQSLTELGDTLKFAPPKASPQIADAAITLSLGEHQLQLKINAMGRVHLCAPKEAGHGIPAC